MSLDTSWDPEKYRGRGETDDHWELKRRLIDAHKDKFPEDRLVCLAQVFANVEFLGCRYHPDVMKQVAELSKGVVEPFREKRKDKLKRTFVKASDAAEAKQQRGTKRPAETPSDESEPPRVISNYSTQPTPYDPTIPIPPITQPLPGSISKYQPRCPAKNGNDGAAASNTGAIPKRLNIGQKSALKPDSDPLEGVVLLEHGYQEDGANCVLQRSGSASNMPLNLKYSDSSDGIQCTIEMGGHVVASCTARTKREARDKAQDQALEILRQICYTIKVKKQVIAYSQVGKEDMLSKDGSQQADGALGSDNLGNRLMRLMGWTGGGLGKSGQGIQEPVQVNSTVSRAGLGLEVTSTKDFRLKVKQKLREFKVNDTGCTDLTFTTEFTNEERAVMHKIAHELGLKSQSLGKGTDRYLVISKKVGVWSLLEDLMFQGGSNEKYEVIPPKKLAQ